MRPPRQFDPYVDDVFYQRCKKVAMWLVFSGFCVGFLLIAVGHLLDRCLTG